MSGWKAICAVADIPVLGARRVERATGHSPVRFLQRMRVERAVELLESTQLSLEEIASRVGYAEPSTLRRLIQRYQGSGPRQLRGGSADARARRPEA